MGSTIYTRKGDKGDTSLVDGRRVPKDAERVEAYGAVDEANSWVGAARAFVDDPLLDRTLEFIQHRFCNCSSNLATPPGSPVEAVGINHKDVEFLEATIDRFEQATGTLDRFIVPGGSRAAAMLHVARAVCRRAERRVVTLGGAEQLDPLVIMFLNRCSDLLFAAARYANRADGTPDVAWDKDLPRPPVVNTKI